VGGETVKMTEDMVDSGGIADCSSSSPCETLPCRYMDDTCRPAGGSAFPAGIGQPAGWFFGLLAGIGLPAGRYRSAVQ
jgi:hypothetical protein